MLRLALWTAAMWAMASAASSQDYATKSGIKLWVDPATPEERQTYTSSRGRSWDLVMSDEFNTANRSFKPGADHLWTSLEKPDGVNGALEIYSHNMTSTACDDDGTCYFFIKVEDEVTTVHVYNAYLNPPAYQDVDFFYRAAMVQSWNKFCFQGGMMEVRAQLPGAVESTSGNPDLALGSSGQVTTGKFYPTWPGIWMLGNLGRAIFSASTNRMWPFSYDKCDPDVFEPTNQRISACDDNPGYGMNPNQGRGAPEIDILEGGGTAISSSLQIAPGMPTDYRLFPADTKGADEANPYCVYSYNCETPGANYIDVPTAYYESERGHKSWYQGLRYAANNFCKGTKSSEWTQTYASVSAAIEKGITQNTCSAATCPASGDVNGDLDVIDGVGSNHWGINTNGTCYPMMNSYMGAYLCDPDNMDEKCSSPRNASTPKTNTMPTFSYQMDAISSNWPVHLGAYTSFLTYQLEWVTGKAGYVRWMLEGHPIFEVTTDAFSNVPQNSNKTNPEKVMLEEPMYVIFNVALSRSWGVSPPNAGSPCRGDGTDATNNAICDSFPMYMKIDYIRLYQDLGDDLPDDQYMQIGCDPKSHPTKGWIEGHITEYVDDDNPMKTVLGGAFCSSDLDCTIGSTTGNSTTTKRSTTNKLVTGKCVKSRCSCSTSSWGGPRCTTALGESEQSGSLSTRVYGPPMGLSLGVAGIVVVCSFVAVYMSVRALSKEAEAALKAAEAKAGAAAASPKANNLDVSYSNIQPKDNYSQNFV